MCGRTTAASSLHHLQQCKLGIGHSCAAPPACAPSMSVGQLLREQQMVWVSCSSPCVSTMLCKRVCSTSVLSPPSRCMQGSILLCSVGLWRGDTSNKIAATKMQLLERMGSSSPQHA
jgi:hypothetical protein